MALRNFRRLANSTGTCDGARANRFVRELALAQRFWKERGFATDVVIVNDYPGSYYDALQDQIIGLLRDIFHSPDHPGVYLLREHSWPARTSLCWKRWRLVHCTVIKGPLPSKSMRLKIVLNIQRWLPTHRYCPIANGPAMSSQRNRVRIWSSGMERGDFAQDGREYHIRLNPISFPPCPGRIS